MIRTARLVFRPLDPALARGLPHRTTALALYAEHAGPGDDGGWLLTLADGTVVGECRWRLDAGGDAEISYAIVPAYRGMGYGGEAVAALVGWVRAQPGVRRVVAEVDASNLPSRRLLQRLGFVDGGSGTIWSAP